MTCAVLCAASSGVAQQVAQSPRGMRPQPPRRLPASLTATARQLVAADDAPPEMALTARTPSPETAGNARYDAAVEQAAWYAQHPNPNEPLGFSGARIRPAGQRLSGGATVSPASQDVSAGSLSADVMSPEALPSEADSAETVPADALPADGMPTDGVPADAPLEFLEEHYEHGDGPMMFDAPAPATSSGEWIRQGCWYTQQSAVYISRSTGPKNSIVLATDVQVTVFAHDAPFLQVPIDMGWEPGLRSTLGRRIGRDLKNRDHSVEFTFLGLTHWQVGGGLESISGNSLFTNIDPTVSIPAFNFSRQQTFDLASDFNSYELNYRIDRRLSRDQMVYTRDSEWVRRAAPALLPSISAGIRVANINERFAWFARETNPIVADGAYLVDTSNTLVGPQAGFDVFYERADWRIGMRTKAAAMVNWAEQSTHVRILDANGAPLEPNRDEHAAVHEASCVAELNFIGAYHIRPRFAVRVSYDLMWATNLALAQNQLTFNSALPAEIANSNSLFYQGLSFGCELTR
ncbi:MAG: hypothetical protein AB7E98_12525 [Pirellulales bacterium]